MSEVINLSKAKKMAKRLVRDQKASGHDMPLSAAQEQTARMLGFETWDLLCGLIDKGQHSIISAIQIIESIKTRLLSSPEMAKLGKCRHSQELVRRIDGVIKDDGFKSILNNDAYMALLDNFDMREEVRLNASIGGMLHKGLGEYMRKMAIAWLRQSAYNRLVGDPDVFASVMSSSEKQTFAEGQLAELHASLLGCQAFNLKAFKDETNNIIVSFVLRFMRMPESELRDFLVATAEGCYYQNLMPDIDDIDFIKEAQGNVINAAFETLVSR